MKLINEENDLIAINELKQFKYWNSKISQDTLEYCKNRFSDIKPFNNKVSEFVYRLENKIEVTPKCPICGKPLLFLTYKNGYREICSNQCKFSKTGTSIIKFNRHINDKIKYQNISDLNNIIEQYKDNNINDEYIKNLFIVNNKIIPGRLNLKYLIRNKKYDVISYLYYRYRIYDLTKKKAISEIVYRIVNNIDTIPLCEICNRPLTYLGYLYGYGKYCSECKKDKKKLAAHFLQKSRKTYKERTGVDNPYKNKDVRKKIKETWKSNGYLNPMQSHKIKQHVANTNIKRYGVKAPILLKSVKENAHSQDAINKCDITKRKNNTYSSSKPEELLYKNLIKIFGKENIIRNYKSEYYRWKCDFYISNYDVYIELQGSWMHGKHPYNENDINDVLKAKKLLEKSEEINQFGKKKKSYLGVLHTWTVSDPLKRKTAKENNLNYLEIFSCNENVILNQISDYFKEHFNIEINGEPI